MYPFGGVSATRRYLLLGVEDSVCRNGASSVIGGSNGLSSPRTTS
jgi:hypothetical protein